MRAKLVAGNWKMHGSLSANEKLLSEVVTGCAGLQRARVAVCVPYPYLAQAQVLLTGTPLLWGAQNVSEHAKGAYTGEVSAAMLSDFGCTYVTVGHSERRTLYDEDSETVALKFETAKNAGLMPILCVGETLEQRDAGKTQAVVDEQLAAVMDKFGVEALSAGVVAYEPVWAIGTGKTATPEQAQAVHRHIRERIAAQSKDVAEKLLILYGGSVKGANAAELFAMADIDGGLIGGASLIGSDFIAICRAAEGA